VVGGGEGSTEVGAAYVTNVHAARHEFGSEVTAAVVAEGGVGSAAVAKEYDHDFAAAHTEFGATVTAAVFKLGGVAATGITTEYDQDAGAAHAKYGPTITAAVFAKGGVTATGIVKVYVLSSLETQGIKAVEALFGAHLLHDVFCSVSDKVQLVNAIVRSYSSSVQIATEVCGVAQSFCAGMCVALRILPGVGEWRRPQSGSLPFQDIGRAAVSNVMGKIVQLEADQRTKDEIKLIVKKAVETLNLEYSRTEQFKCPVLRQGSWHGDDAGPTAFQLSVQANVLGNAQKVVRELGGKVLNTAKQKKLATAQQDIAFIEAAQRARTAQQ
jgi:hypothetical protein